MLWCSISLGLFFFTLSCSAVQWVGRQGDQLWDQGLWDGDNSRGSAVGHWETPQQGTEAQQTSGWGHGAGAFKKWKNVCVVSFFLSTMQKTVFSIIKPKNNIKFDVFFMLIINLFFFFILNFEFVSPLSAEVWIQQHWQLWWSPWWSDYTEHSEGELMRNRLF